MPDELVPEEPEPDSGEDDELGEDGDVAADPPPEEDPERSLRPVEYVVCVHNEADPIPAATKLASPTTAVMPVAMFLPRVRMLIVGPPSCSAA